MYIRIEIVTGEDNRFRILCENSISENARSHKDFHADGIEHGYGLSNIRNIVYKYYGFMVCPSDDPWVIRIEIPITSAEQFITPPSTMKSL